MHPHNDKAIWVVIALILFLLVGNFVFTQYQLTQFKNAMFVNPSSLNTTNTSPLITESNFTCGSDCQTYISQTVTKLLSASLTATPTATATPKSTAQPAPTRITYIPLTAGSTQATDWVTIAGSQFTLNITDYGAKAYAVWDANLRVDNANGTTFARLFDTTHGIAINGSEIKVTNTGSSTNVVSGQLSFWQGNNSYVVQLKSLNSSTAYLDSARIKINY